MLLPVLLLFFNVMLCVNEFAIKSDILCGEKEKFKCETVKTYITSVKKNIYIYKILRAMEKMQKNYKDLSGSRTESLQNAGYVHIHSN